MKKKRIIVVIVLIVGIALIGCGIFFSIGNTGSKSNKQDKVDNTQKEENPEEKDISYDEAVKIIESLYKEDGYTLEIKEEESRFVINKKNDNGEITNTFYMDKQTGYFSEEAKSSTTAEPIQVG